MRLFPFHLSIVIWTKRWLRKRQAMVLYSKQIYWHERIYWAHSISEIIICIQTFFRVGASILTCTPPKLFSTGTWGVSPWRRVREWKIWWRLKMWSLGNHGKSKMLLWEWSQKNIPNREAWKAKRWFDFSILASFLQSSSKPDKPGFNYSLICWKEFITKLSVPRICPHYFSWRSSNKTQELNFKFLETWKGECTCLH